MTNDSTQGTSPQIQEETFDTTGLLLAFLAQWKWFVLSVVVCLIVAYFNIASKIPVYQVNASIYLSDDNNSGQNAFSMNASDPMVALKNYIDETELEVMKSRNNVIKIVDSLNLAYTYYAKGRFRDIPLYEDNAVIAKLDSMALKALKAPITITVKAAGEGTYDVKAQTSFNGVEEEKEFENISLPAQIELSQGTVTLTRSPIIANFEGTEIIRIVNPLAAAGRISGSLSIEFAKNSDKIIRLSIQTDVMKRGVDIINALLDFYNRDIIEEKNRSAVQTEAFILDRLVMISGELKDVENRLQAYRQAHNVTDIQAQSNLNLNLQSNYESQMAEVEADLSLYDEIERIVSSSDSYETLPAAVNNPTITTIIEAYNRKVGQLNRTLEGSTPDNPLVKTMQEELSRDKVRILQNLSTAKRALTAKRGSIRQLENRSAGQLASTPTIDKGLQEIFREQQVKVNIYTFLLQRREEIALQKTLATNTARLIDDPEGSGPVSPRKMMVYGMALIIGLLIPAAIIFVRRLLFPIFSDQEELERITKVPVLAEICQSDSKKSDDLVVGENVSTPIAELFRLLRNNISFTRSGVNSKVILVTSTISGEGKTFVASNLALTYALMGKKVVVIGMDLRRPMLAHNFGLTNQRGVTTFLSGQEADIDSLIVQSNVNDNLYILPAGPIPPNPNELLMSANMSRMMSRLRNEYDYVIIDSAPIGVISDTFLITRHSDLQLYVTRANYSTKSSLKVLHQAVDSGKFSSVYIVLNGVNIASNSYLYRRYGEYGHYGRKGHAYGYGYASNDHAKKA
ncbi:MAG: polysaccharide biosynthesis tyrosine autokinase [Muribaculaceae bacterium]|nr:polysaccharide biosynthesis tyrosine autokinase [Muribaculaceae bacterium]